MALALPVSAPGTLAEPVPPGKRPGFGEYFWKYYNSYLRNIQIIGCGDEIRAGPSPPWPARLTVLGRCDPKVTTLVVATVDANVMLVSSPTNALIRRVPRSEIRHQAGPRVIIRPIEFGPRFVAADQGPVCKVVPMNLKYWARTALILATMIVLSPRWAKAGERYFVMIFGSQSSPKLLRDTHTWATFLRVVGEVDDPAGVRVYRHTISWLPASLNVRTWSLLPEKGVNLDLYDTLDAVLKNGERVRMWGPFEMRPEVYERSLRVKTILDSGEVEYRAIDTARDLLISDCIHAVAAVDPVFGRRHYPLIRVGKPASRFIARQIMTRSVFDQDRTDASWLFASLGLGRYPIEVVPPEQIPRRNCMLCRCPDRARR